MPRGKRGTQAPGKAPTATTSSLREPRGSKVVTGDVTAPAAEDLVTSSKTGTGTGSLAAPAPKPKPAPGPWESGSKVGKWEAGAVGKWKAGGKAGAGTATGGGGGGGGAGSHAGNSNAAQILQGGGHVGSANTINYFDGSSATDIGTNTIENVGFTGGGAGTGTAAAAFTSSKAKAAADTETKSTRRIGLKRTEAPRARTY